MSDIAKREGEEIKRRVVENLDALDRSGKLKVLGLSEELSGSPRRDTRAALLEHAGSIPVEELERIGEAIEEGCERVDEDEW